MKERPILFSGPMVRAILEGRKTQTRRVIKPRPVDVVTFLARDNSPTGEYGLCFHPRVVSKHIQCPYGVLGDLLWVKEACWIWGRWNRDGRTKTGRQRWRFQATGRLVVYDKPGTTATRDGSEGWVYRHARFMPRWASRIILENTEVRVQRVQAISEEDAIAEGIEPLAIDPLCPVGTNRYTLRFGGGWHNAPSARGVFRMLWNHIHGPNAWERNEWVWAVTFKVIEEWRAA